MEVDGQSVELASSDSVLLALLRAGRHPTGGGCLCLTGDCPHCLATVDGISYVRTCQVPARAGMTVQLDHQEKCKPPLWSDAPPTSIPAVRHLHCDVVIVGQGRWGCASAIEARQAGKHVVTLDVRHGQEVIGIYAGPSVIARTTQGMLQVHPREEIILATGSRALQPIVPGSDRAGLLTVKAAERLVTAGIDLGRVVAVGSPPSSIVPHTFVEGVLEAFEGEAQVQAVVVRSATGTSRSVPCDSVIVELGRTPRDELYRMARDFPVRLVGSAATPGDLPRCPTAGVLCPCSGTQIDAVAAAWERGFRDLELLKRATLAGTGACQGSSCMPYLRSFLVEKGNPPPAPFTARPVTRALTFAEVAAGANHRATPRTALDGEHRRLGAHMERAGGWWRPWTYGEPDREYQAARQAVSLCDVSTLGKMLISGPDAVRLLEFLYPAPVTNLAIGACRYMLLLDERGYVFDDGMVCRVSETRFTLTFTSTGATHAELWIRDWAESLAVDVRLLNVTTSLGAINVTGPRAADLLGLAGATTLPGYLRHTPVTIAGVQCQVYRLSFTGELSFELHHDAADSLALWRRLLERGRSLGIQPHGLETMLRLRLEKGHLVVGQDTDYDSTPRRIAHEWAVRLDQEDFIGRSAILRTNKVELDRQLVGLEMPSPAPQEGAVLWSGSDYAGYITSSTDSPTLGKAVMLGWVELREGKLPEELRVDDRSARRVATPFYDKDGKRARTAVQLPAKTEPAVFHSKAREDSAERSSTRLQRLAAFRVVARREALDELQDGLRTQGAGLALRFAADELWTTAAITAPQVADESAIIVADSGFSGVWLEQAQAFTFLESACPWELPSERPAFAQGSIADLPVKLWLEHDRVLFLVVAPLAHALEQRLP